MAVPLSDRPNVKVGAYWALCAKYKWRLAIATLSLTLLFVVIIGELPNIYEATTTILVDPQQVPEKFVSPVESSDPYARLNTISQQVLSRTRLQQIINKFNLYADKRMSLSREEIIEKMRQDISLVVKQGSGPELSTFSLTYQGKQPALVAMVANELAASFIQWSITSRVEQVAGTKEFLGSELMAAKQSLEKQETALREFKMSHLGETPDQTTSNLEALAGLRAALQANADAINRLDEQKLLLTRAPAPPTTSNSNGTDLTPRERLELEKQQLEATIEQLRGHYSDRYPDVARAEHRLEAVNAQLRSMPVDSTHSIAAGTEEKPVVPVRLELVDQEMKKLEAEQNQIRSQIETYQARVDAAPIREQQLIELTRNYDISKQHYQTLLDKTFTIGMAADLERNQKAERFRVLDPASVPEKPVKPNRKKLIPFSGVLALGLSILFLVAKDEFSPAIKTEMELKSLLPPGMHIWGFIPRIQVLSDTRRERQIATYASLTCILLCMALVEAIRLIRPF
jgi:polysaccharide biosynthesis transport protein